MIIIRRVIEVKIKSDIHEIIIFIIFHYIMLKVIK